MYKKIALTLFVALAILFGCASATPSETEFAASITLELYPSSSQWWLAVDPLGDGNATVTVQLQENGDTAWQTMQGNPSWGFWQLAATHDGGFKLPISFQLTSSAGETIQLMKVLTTIAGADIATDVQFSDDGHGHHTNEPTQAATQAPTKKPSTPAPTQPAPTQKPATPAPTQKATPAPTQKATAAPTQAPTKKPATQAPTQKPATQAPTKKPTTSGSSSGGNTDLCSVTSTSSEPLTIVVPLYEDPDANWDALITAAATGVPILAIINPDDGPVKGGPDSSYKTYMTKFQKAGITMIGYVHTLYGARSLSDVEADVALYASKYPGLAGIFVDEASPDKSELSYYTSLYNYARSFSGYTNVMVNPGAIPDQGYLQASTNLMIFENPANTWSSQSSNYPSWVKCASDSASKAGWKYRFSGVSYATSTSQMSTLIQNMATAGIGMVYASSASDVCCIYNTLTPYFSSMVTAVNALN